ncbi:MAG: hypothetical protein ASARMPREDX12_008072 [Alectoria sarmentosa]|nr:MAG: hypothetical protein ASARMPREDX12_008072 [Alectoria sarmentosa]
MTNARPTLQWSLDSTASTTISVARDVIRAATSDNVQALALIACEKFGATLAMCQETNKKMEDLVIRVSGPKLVRFMSAQIGYSANDCATQLSRSLAGVQFLGLAAALVSSVGIFDGANALDMMLMNSASDKTLLPTARQLKDLFGAMEHRINRSGFTDVWIGYQTMVFGGLNVLYEHSGDHSSRMSSFTEFMRYPGIDGISKLVEAFRELDRLGDVIAITIQATSCAPWVMAFTRWCLGTPPSTYLPNGRALLDQPASRVTLFTSNDAKASAFEITVQRSIDSPAYLLRSEVSPRSPSGMVTVECFGQIMCQEMGGAKSDAYKAMSEALPYAIKQTHELLLISNSVGPFTAGGLEQRANVVGEYSMEISTQPFPPNFMISNILTRFLNSENQQHLQCLVEGCLISDLPLVQVHFRRLAETCSCDECQRTCQTSTGRYDNKWGCRKRDFLLKVAGYAADILALSLFEGPQTPLKILGHGTRTFQNFYSFGAAINDIISSSKPAKCGARAIIGWALTLVGHEVNDLQNARWVISCSKGQAVYPKVFETGGICEPGYLKLNWAPGQLFFNGNVYERGISPQLSRLTPADPVSMQPSRPVLEPLNLMSDMRMEWKVVTCDGYLEIQLVCGPYTGQAFSILLNLEKSLILRGCPHDSTSPLDRPDLFADYTGPFSPDREDPFPQARTTPEGVARIGIVAVDGDAGLRMLTLSRGVTHNAGPLQIVIRDNSYDGGSKKI